MACGDSQPLIGIQAAYMQSAPLSRRPRFGKVVNIGSNLVYNPVVTYYDYTAAKAALVGLTRNLAAELGHSRTCRKGTVAYAIEAICHLAFCSDTGRQMLPVPSHTYLRTHSLCGGLTFDRPSGVRVNLVAGGLLETTDASALTTKEVLLSMIKATQRPPLDPPYSSFPLRVQRHTAQLF